MNKTTITLALSTGPFRIKANVINGLAYHPQCVFNEDDGDIMFSEMRWSVSHVASGRTMLPGYELSLPSEEACLTFIDEVKDLADWSLSAEQLWQQHGPLLHPASAAMVEALRNAYHRALTGQQAEVRHE